MTDVKKNPNLCCFRIDGAVPMSTVARQPRRSAKPGPNCPGNHCTYGWGWWSFSWSHVTCCHLWKFPRINITTNPIPVDRTLEMVGWNCLLLYLFSNEYKPRFQIAKNLDLWIVLSLMKGRQILLFVTVIKPSIFVYEHNKLSFSDTYVVALISLES